MNGKNRGMGALGLLGLLAALEGMKAQHRSPAERELANHTFQPLAEDKDPAAVEDHRRTLGFLQEKFSQMNINDTDTVVLLALNKGDPNAVCGDCGKMHDPDSPRNALTLGFVGNVGVAANLTDVFLRYLQDQVSSGGFSGDGRMSLDQMFAEFEKNQGGGIHGITL